MPDFLEKGNQDAAQAVKEEPAAGITPDTTAGASQGDKTAVLPGAEGKEQDLSGLTDEQFEKVVARLVSDQKSPFHKNPAWQRIVSQRNQSTQKAEAVFARYAQKDPQGAMEMLMDEGMDEAQAQAQLENIGVDLTQSEETKQSLPKTDVDETGFMKLLNGMGVQYGQLTPEQIDFWKFQYKFNRQMMSPVNEFIKQSKTEKEKAELTQARNSLEKEEKELSTQVKEKYGLDWQKEVIPELSAYLKENSKFVGTLKQLFREVFFDRIEELGKRAKSVEDSKLNEEKKRIKSEDGGSSDGETKPAGVGKNFNTTWEYLKNKYK